MIELSRGLSYVAYSYEGGPLRFTCTFPFLKQEHVRVLVGKSDSPRTVLGTWINSTTIEIPDQSEYLQTPFSVALRRFTPIDDQAVHFQDAAQLPASQLNTAVRQLLYIQQELREFGVDGNGMPGGGLPAGGGGGIPDINTIINQVVQSPAYQILQDRIPEIDANAELILEELLRSDSFFDRNRDFTDRISEASTRISLMEDVDKVTAEQITVLLARMTTGEADSAAQFQQVNRAIATETEARVTSMTDLYAQVKTDIATNIAAVSETVNIVANEAGASTEWRHLFAAQYGNSGADGTSVAAAVKQQIDTKATAAEAQAIANTTVDAFANGTFASLQESYNAYVSKTDGMWSGLWSLRINGGNTNNPVVAGLSLSATAAGSSFVVQSDVFAIAPPSGDYAARKFPFVVGTVGGLSTVGITGQLLVDGSITANKLTVNSLAAITANAGTINGGTFKTHTLDANGNVTNAAEFRVELSNVGTWPIWVGAGVKNENNAVFWVDRSGNAGFKGRVSAPNITGTFQRYVVCAWNGSINGANGGTTANFTLPAPVLVGESHIPMIQLSLTLNNTHSDEYGSINVILRRLVGSTWVNIRGPYIVGLNHGENRADALFMADSATTSASTYSVAVSTTSGRSENINLLAVDGLIFGLR